MEGPAIDFDEDDFIFIESDTPTEEVVEYSSPKASCSKPASIRQPPSSHSMQPSTSKPKLKRSFRASPESPGSPDPGQRGGRRRRREEPDSDEERWLDALQQGTLEQVDDELKKMRNPLLLTARQRALLDKRGGDDTNESVPAEPLVALPSGYKEKGAEMTAEMEERHRKQVERRRQQAKQQREQDKKRTVSRLLTKGSEKTVRGAARLTARVPQQPVVRYLQTMAGATLQVPEGAPPVISAQPSREAPKPRLCGVAGCQNLRRYSCSRTGVSLCSLACYRSNLDQRPAAAAS